MLTAGADVCVRGGQLAILAGHLVACRRRQLADRWSDLQAAAGDAQTPPADPKQAEAGWRQRMQAARDALARAQTFAEALQSRINALSNDFAARDDPAQRARVAEERQRSLALMDRVKMDIEKANKAIADLEEEARKAAVPPGWLR